jgi:hypothetical protein
VLGAISRTVALAFAIAGCAPAPMDTPDDPSEGGILTFDGAMLGTPDAGSDARARDARVMTDARIDEASDTRLFVPDFPNTYGGPMADPGFEVIAHTVRRLRFEADYLVAIQNTFGLTICALDLETIFFDDGGRELARTRARVETSPHRGVSGTGGLVPGCLGPGQIGMQSVHLRLASDRIGEIARAEWIIGGINLTDAVPSTDLAITGVVAEPDPLGGRHFTGRLENRTGSTLRYPAVAIFGVNAVGRPLFASGRVGDTSVAAGGSWTFETFPTFEETYASYVGFPDGSD